MDRALLTHAVLRNKTQRSFDCISGCLVQPRLMYHSKKKAYVSQQKAERGLAAACELATFFLFFPRSSTCGCQHTGGNPYRPVS